MSSVDVSRSEELSQLASEWQQSWDEVQTDVDQDRTQLQTQVGFYTEALTDEQKRLQSEVDRVTKNSENEWTVRKTRIEQTIGNAITTLEKFLKRKGDGAPPSNYFRELHLLLHDILSRQIPLYEMNAPTKNILLLNQSLQEFDNLFTEWQRVSPVKDETPTPRKRGIVSKVKSRLRGFFGKTPPAATASARAANVKNAPQREQFRRSLEVRLLEVSTNYLRTLRLLMNDIMADARERWSRQKRALLNEEEKRTGITQIKQAATGARLALENRDLALHRAKLVADERKDELEKQLDDAKNRLKSQEALIAQTMAQQQLSSAPPAVTKPLPIKRDYPAVDVEFAKHLKRLYPQLYLNPTSIAQGSACASPDSKDIPPRKPYQELFRRILTVDSPYRGFLGYHGVGSGKTRLGWETIDQWFTDHILADGVPGSAVLVLLPTNKLIGGWVSEARRWISEKQFTIREYSKTDNTTVLEFIPNPTTFGERTPVGHVILHKMTVLPDAASVRVMTKDLPQDQELIETLGYSLPDYKYDSHEAYKNLKPEERLLLNRMLEEQKREIQSRTKLIIPSKTLVIVDEAHNLVNPQEIVRSVVASRTTLAWSNLLRQATQVKLLLLTATPLLDDSKLTDLFKLLNLLQTDKDKRIFEGTWRSSLPTDEPDAVKEAAAHADELESLYLQQQLLANTGEWLPKRKEALQQWYAGIVSYLTLTNDPTVYPALDTTCNNDPNSSCSYLWNTAKQDLEELPIAALESYGLPKPKTGKNVLTPMSARQFKEMSKAIQSDLGTWKEHRRADALTPEQASPEGLNFSGPPRTFKSSVMQSWGMRSYTERGSTTWPQKAYALLNLMKVKYPNDKFFVYTSSQMQWFATQLTDFLSRIGEYEVWDIPKVAKFVSSHTNESQGNEADKKLAQAWLTENAANKKRVLMFIGSASALKDLHPRVQGLVRDMMLSLYNQSSNLNGELFQAFIGDRSTKEGISLMQTKHAVFLEPSANATMQTQAEARILRFCSLSRFPFDQWRKVQLWRMISIPPPPGGARATLNRRRRVAGFGGHFHHPMTRTQFNGLVIAARLSRIGVPNHFGRRRYGGQAAAPASRSRTNEEWHYVYLNSQKPPSTTILQALKEIAIDCLLFRDYNGDPSVPYCYGQTPTQVPSINNTTGIQSLKPRFDRFCTSMEYLLLQDESANELTEFSTNDVNPEGVWDADSFERRCQLGKAPVVMLGAVGYRDLLILEALKAPASVDSAAIEKQFGVAPDQLIIKEIFQMISKGAVTSGPEAAQPWSLQQELKLWMLVSGLSDSTNQRGALERFIQHRVDRLKDAERQRLSGIVEQITTWMALRLALDFAIDALINFLQRKPNFTTLFTRSGPRPRPLPPRIMNSPTAPPLSRAGGFNHRLPFFYRF